MVSRGLPKDEPANIQDSPVEPAPMDVGPDEGEVMYRTVTSVEESS